MHSYLALVATLQNGRDRVSGLAGSSQRGLRPIHPRDCVLAVALPRDEDQFLQDAAAREKRFARELVQGCVCATPRFVFASWYRPLLAHLHRTLAAVKARGVQVHSGIDLAQFADLFQTTPVVTLVAPWWSDRGLAGEIELADGIHEARHLARAVPVGYRGVFDFSCCHSRRIASELRWDVNCRLLMGHQSISIAAFLDEYQRLIARLALAPNDFPSAKTAIGFHRQHRFRRAR